MEEALRNFELQTFSKFSVYQKDKNFGSHGAGAQLGGGGGGGGGVPTPFFFLKLKTIALILEKKPGCVNPYVKFTIQNVVLRVFKRKIFNIFPAEPFSLEFLTTSPLP